MQRSFYYWKTVFSLSPAEKKILHQLSVKTLYVKLFDVEWNTTRQTAEPVAKSIFQHPPPSGISLTPVLFITQEPLQQLNKTGLNELAQNMGNLCSTLAANNDLQLTNEVQLDCDWNARTREAYFYLLEQLRQQPFFQNKKVSATIRLHQLKFITQNGVPPVDKGLLMCYNMGNLRHPQTQNSIIEEEEVKKYINNLEDYKLPLDVALPVFDWYLLFDGNRFKGIIRDFRPGEELAQEERIVFTSDTTIDGHPFKSGQWLRHEKSEAAVVKICAERISKKLKANKLTVILYRLDQTNLTKYHQHELESFYNSFR